MTAPESNRQLIAVRTAGDQEGPIGGMFWKPNGVMIDPDVFQERAGSPGSFYRPRPAAALDCPPPNAAA